MEGETEYGACFYDAELRQGGGIKSISRNYCQAEQLSCNYRIKLSSAASNYAGAANTESDYTTGNLIDLTH